MQTTQQNQISTATWLPVFNGFDCTILGTFLEFDNAVEFLNEDREEKGLSKITFDDLEIDYKAASNALAQKIFDAVSEKMKEFKLIDGSFFENLKSPKFYNYSNDSIECTLNFSKENIETIEKYLSDNKESWDKYLKKNFTSRSGFHSWYDNTIDSEDWNNVIECLHHDFKCGSILEFILLNEGYNHASVYYNIEFYDSEFVTNYTKLQVE